MVFNTFCIFLPLTKVVSAWKGLSYFNEPKAALGRIVGLLEVVSNELLDWLIACLTVLKLVFD